MGAPEGLTLEQVTKAVPAGQDSLGGQAEEPPEVIARHRKIGFSSLFDIIPFSWARWHSRVV